MFTRAETAIESGGDNQIMISIRREGDGSRLRVPCGRAADGRARTPRRWNLVDTEVERVFA